MKHDSIVQFYYVTRPWIVWFYTVVAVYLGWLILHQISAHLYSKYCAPLSFVGILRTLVVGPTPLCHALRWVIYNSGDVIHHMWKRIGTWTSFKLLYGIAE